MLFSIITVCLNSGDKLGLTLESVLDQSFGDFEVIVKDGGSTDGSVKPWMNRDSRIKCFVEKDKGIYEAMNQAVGYASGEYVLFLNSGDVFADRDVLLRTAEKMNETAQSNRSDGKNPVRRVFYGDTLGGKNDVVITSAPEINGFTCYRNIPCHQSCFYSLTLCKEKPYDLKYRIRADYDHFLWCYYRGKAEFTYLGFPISCYEGGGFSESKANRKKDKAEHREIVEEYMGAGELLKYRAIMAITLAPVRSFMAENPVLSGVYHKIKTLLYRK